MPFFLPFSPPPAFARFFPFMLLLGSIDCGLLSSLTTGLRHKRLLAKGALSLRMLVWPLLNPPFRDTMQQGGEAGPTHCALGESRCWA